MARSLISLCYQFEKKYISDFVPLIHYNTFYIHHVTLWMSLLITFCVFVHYKPHYVCLLYLLHLCIPNYFRAPDLYNDLSHRFSINNVVENIDVNLKWSTYNVTGANIMPNLHFARRNHIGKILYMNLSILQNIQC